MLCIALAVVVPLCVCLPAASAATDLSERFRTEAPLGWNALRQFSSNCKGVARVSTVPQAGAVRKSNPWTVEYRWNRLAGNERFEYSVIAGEATSVGELQALVANPRYGFIVARPRDEESFVVRSIVNDPQRTIEKANAFQLQAIGLNVDAESADGIALDPSFRVSNIESKTEGAEEFITVDFECDVRHRPDYIVKSGWMTFLPQKKWAVSSYLLKIDYPDVPGVAHGACEYADETLNGIPIPTTQVCDRSNLTGDAIYLRISHQYTDIGRGTATLDECSLPAFGLPEFDPPAHGWANSALLAWLTIGVVLLLVGVLVLWTSRRWLFVQ